MQSGIHPNVSVLRVVLLSSLCDFSQLVENLGITLTKELEAQRLRVPLLVQIGPGFTSFLLMVK